MLDAVSLAKHDKLLRTSWISLNSDFSFNNEQFAFKHAKAAKNVRTPGTTNGGLSKTSR